MSSTVNTATDRKPGDVAIYVAMAEAVARMTFALVYLWDNTRSRFIYLSDNRELLGGKSAAHIMALGIDELKEMIPDEDLALLKKVTASFEGEYSRIPADLRHEVVVYLNFHLGHGNDSILVNQKISWFDFDAFGRPGIIFGIATPSVHRDNERFVFMKIGSADIFRYFDPETNLWHETHRIHITDDERRMLRLSQSGYSSKEIASMMNKAADTIGFYRKSVYEKLDVRNIAEAVAHAVHYGII